MATLNREQVFADILAENTTTNAINRRVMVKHIMPLLLVSLLATCTSPSYAIAPHYQPLNDHSFNCVDKVAVTSNNARQELQNLLKPVQHHTIVDVFLCLSFASLPFMGELRLAVAFIALWWGGHGNKPFIGRIPCAVGFNGSEPPCRPTFRANHQNIITHQKGIKT